MRSFKKNVFTWCTPYRIRIVKDFEPFVQKHTSGLKQIFHHPTPHSLQQGFYGWFTREVLLLHLHGRGTCARPACKQTVWTGPRVMIKRDAATTLFNRLDLVHVLASILSLIFILGVILQII